jgi:exoribonuclease R
MPLSLKFAFTSELIACYQLFLSTGFAEAGRRSGRHNVRMARRRVLITPPAPHARTAVETAFSAARAELKVPTEFPPEVLTAATDAAADHPVPPDDLTDVPFFTLDPKGSTDLDQAMHLARRNGGYRLRYAIAAVPVFVAPGGPIDVEARHRGQTLYSPDVRTPLHPEVLSENAASLLPGQKRPAFVWDMALDDTGQATAVDLRLARIRSVAQLDYESAEPRIEVSAPDEPLALLKEIGELRQQQETQRGGASLPMPEQEVALVDGRYRLHFRPPAPIEDWNAQISLLTGMAAAQIMLTAKVGILRTMPAATPEALTRFRHQATALDAHWAHDVAYGDFLRSLDRDNPRHLALIHEAVALFRGAGYTPFDGDVPDQTVHAAVAAAYAHVTAPLRRLVDRFGLAVCEAVQRTGEAPEWARAALPDLPAAMTASDRLAGDLERACTDIVEAAVLSQRGDETFDGVVVDLRHGDEPIVQLSDPAVLAPADGHAGLGDQVKTRVAEADIATRHVRLTIL